MGIKKYLQEYKMRTILVPICFLALILFSISYGNTKRDHSIPQEDYEVTVTLIIVDLIAIDREGNFVADLSLNDFEVYEDGKKMPINSLDLIRYEPKKTSEPKSDSLEEPVIISDRLSREKRFFVIFDSINTIRRLLNRSKSQILENLKNLVQSGGEVMVLEIEEKGGIKILQPFTSIKELIAQAVEKASGSIWVEKDVDELVIPDILSRREASDRAAFKADEGIHIASKAMYEFKKRLRFEKSLSSLRSIMNMIKDYPGRKPVLLVSGGFPTISLDRIGIKSGITSEVAHSDLKTAKISDPFRVLHKGGRRYEEDIINDLIQFANSHNISFYTIDPDSYLRYVLPDMAFDNYLIPDISRIKQYELSTLKYIAEDTGGEALQGAKKYEEFQKVVLRDVFSYYELSYYPPRESPDEKYHNIKVRCLQPGVKIQFRKGYFDYSLKQKESLLFASTSSNPYLFKQITFQAKIVPFVSNKGNYIFWINMGFPAESLILGEDTNKKLKIIKVNLWVDDQRGRNAMNANLAIPFHLTPLFREALKHAKYYGYNTCSQELKLDQGQYKIVVTAYDEENERVGTVEQLLHVPSLEGDKQAEVINAVFGYLKKDKKTGKLFALSPEDGSLQLSKYKFLPLGTNNFAADEDISIFLQIFTEDENLKFFPRFRLFQRDKIRGVVPSVLVEEYRNKKAKVLNTVFRLSFQGFVPGEYMLCMDMMNGENYQKIEKIIPIKIIK